LIIANPIRIPKMAGSNRITQESVEYPFLHKKFNKRTQRMETIMLKIIELMCPIEREPIIPIKARTK
jgi:hypothetical protein